jgi:hypothetical protein
MSEKEKRTLNQLPVFSITSLFSKDYSAKLDSFLSDHVLKRDSLVKYAKNFESSLKHRMNIEYVPDQKSKRQDSGSDILILPDRILMLYIRNTKTIKDYANAVESVFEVVPDHTNKYFFVAPGRIEFENDEYKKYSDSQKADIQIIYNLLPKDVKIIDVYSALLGKDINKVFFRTDHHWTQLGAYYAANAILSATKHAVVDIDNFQQKKGSNYLGYLYAKYQVKAKALEAHPDELYYYTDGNIPDETVYYTDEKGSTQVKEEKLIDPSRGGYYTFVISQFEYAIINGKNKQGGCLFLVADSYGCVLTTWLAERYNKIVIIEPRYYKGGKNGLLQLFAKHQVTDFMIGQCMTSIIPYYTNEINRLSGISGLRH